MSPGSKDFALRTLALLALALAPGASPAWAEARVRAEVDSPRVGLEDQLQLSVVVEGDEDVTGAPLLPALKGLRVAGGPMVSQQFSFVNGRSSQSRTFTWVLQPLAVGRAEIPPVRVPLASGEKGTQPIGVEVVAGAVKPRARPQARDPFEDDPFAPFFGREQRRPAREPKLYVELAASRNKLRVGEPLLLTYYVYTQVAVTDLSFKDAPQYPGFWARDLEQPKGPLRTERTVVEGEEYQRAAIVQKLLFPTRAGALTIPETTLRLGVPRGGFFDTGPAPVERRTKPLTITAEPLPSEPGFSGAVGRFQARASLDKAALALGEAATLRFELSGTGNLEWLEQGPEVKVAGARVFPPQARSDLRPTPAGLTGTRTWEYVLVPETAGALEVPALGFRYFDPEAGRIVAVETQALPLRVEGGAPGAAPLSAAAARPAPRAAAGGLVLRSDLDPPRRLLPEPGPRLLSAGLALLLLAHAALWGAGRLALRGAAGPGRVTAPGARHALAQLRRATRGDLSKEAAAAAIEKALHDVFGPLEEAGEPADERERAARELLQEVRFIRYAPQLGDYGDKIREVGARAAEVVRRWA